MTEFVVKLMLFLVSALYIMKLVQYSSLVSDNKELRYENKRLTDQLNRVREANLNVQTAFANYVKEGIKTK